MKCTNCGAEFDSKFCPNCGAPAPQKEFCPQCGKERTAGAPFCGQCGYRFADAAADRPRQAAPAQGTQASAAQAGESTQGAVQPPYIAGAAEAPPQEQGSPADGRPCKALAFLDKGADKLYKVLYFFPACAFALVTLLLFAFLAAPVAADPFFGLSAGAGYDFIGVPNELQGALLALLVFGILGAGLSALMLAQVFKKELRYRTVKAFGRTFYRETALAALAGLFLFVYFLLGCILCGQAAGLGLAGGAGPALVIAFSILAGVCAAAPVLRHFLAKREPSLAAPEREAARAYEAAKEAKNADKLAAFLAQEPAQPAPVPKPQRPPFPQSGPVRDVNKVMRKKRRVAFFLIMIGVFAVLALSLGLPYALGTMPSSSFVVGICVASSLWLACTIAGLVLISRRREGKWDERKSCKNGGMTAAATIGGIFGFWWAIGGIVGLIFAFVIDANVAPSAVEMDIVLAVSFFAAAALFLGIFGAALAARGKNRKLAEFFYGARKPLPDAPLRFSFAILNREQLNYLAWRKAYADYHKKQRNLGYEKSCYQKKKLPFKAVLWANGNRVWLSVVAILLVVVLVLVCVLPPVLGNKFRAGNVSRVELGMHDYEVEQILGEPDEQSDTQWVWYGGEYKSLADEAARLEEQLAAATDFSQIGALTERLAELEARAATLEYPVILVEFADGRADAVWLDMHMSAAGSAEKELSSVRVLEGTIEEYATSLTLSYEANFADGSYSKAYATAATEDGTLAEGSRVTVTWSDRWTEYTAEIAVAENRSGYYLDGSTLHVIGNTVRFDNSFDKTSVTALVVEYGVTEIAQGAFNGFTAMDTITLPEGLTSIGNAAFSDTAFYNNAYWENGALYIGQYLVDADNVSGAFTVKEGTVLIADSAFWCEYDLRSLTLPEGVKYIGESAFGSCYSMEGLVLPASLAYIGEDAFSGCTALESITVASGNARYSDAGGSLIDMEQNMLLVGSTESAIPHDGSVTRIAYGAFTYSGNYTNGVLEGGALYVSGCLVAENDSIDGTLTVREGTWLIADWVFEYQVSDSTIEAVVLPDSLEYIGEDAFSGTNLTELVIPDSVKVIGDGAFNWCGELASLTLGSGLTSIGSYAFGNCYLFSSVTIPSGVTYIGAGAFEETSSLQAVFFEQRSGWTISQEPEYGNLSITVSADMLSDPANAATMLGGERAAAVETQDGVIWKYEAVWTRA